MIHSGHNWTLHNADCREVLAGMADASVDLVATDPPYSISIAGCKHVQNAGNGTRNLDFFPGDSDWRAMTFDVVLPAVRETTRILKPTGSAYWWCSHRQVSHIADVLELAGFKTRLIVWRKKCPPPAAPGSGWNSAAEICVYAYKPGRTWNGGNRAPDSVIVSDSYRYGQPGKVDHPTQKPLACFRQPIYLSSNPGDLVLDPFTGSGTSGAVALSCGRRFVGCELSPEYAAIAKARLEDAARQPDLFAAEVR